MTGTPRRPHSDAFLLLADVGLCALAFLAVGVGAGGAALLVAAVESW